MGLFVVLSLPRASAATYYPLSVHVSATSPTICSWSTNNGEIWVARNVPFDFDLQYWLSAPGWFDRASASGYINNDQNTWKSISTDGGPISGNLVWTKSYPTPGTYTMTLRGDAEGVDANYVKCSVPWQTISVTVHVY